MSALIKYSIVPLLAIASAIYLYNLSGGGDFDDVRVGPPDQICNRDGERLAHLRAKPSLDEAVRFGSELRCLKLWPQLLAVLDSLSRTAVPTRSPSSNGTIPSELSGDGNALPASLSPAMEAISPTSGDACNRDEERLAELQAKPSLDEAVRFEDELKCSKLQPQLLALLDGLSQAPRSARAPSPNGAPPNTTSAGRAAPPPASASPAMEAASATPDDACKPDEDRLAKLQAKPSLDEAFLFGSELRCPKLWPQLLAILDSLSHAAGSGDGAAPDTMSAGGAASPDSPAPAMEATSTTLDDACTHDKDRLAKLQAKPSLDEAMHFESELKCPEVWPQLLALLDGLSQAPQSTGAPSPNGAAPDTMSASGAASPDSPSPAMEATSRTLDDACTRDEDRLDRLRHSPSSEEAARFAKELNCEKLRPQVMALTGDLARPPPPGSAGVSKDAAAEMNMTSEAPPASDASATSQAAADADRRMVALERERMVALERERDALAAEVGQLERHRDSTSPRQANPPVWPHPAIPAEQSDREPVPAVATLPDGMPARVLIRYLRNNADARQRAESLANALTRQGIEVADLRESAGAVRTELSFSYAPDEAIAQQVGRLAGVTPVRRPQPKDGLMARPGTVELNLSSDSHLVAITASRRERNHE
jgi:hypothetical protein